MSGHFKLLYFGILGIFAVIAVFALAAGLPIYAIACLFLGAAFMVSGQFVLGKKWRAPAPMPTRRPVVRRRR